MAKTLDIITIGESLIELSGDLSLKDCDSLQKYYGGDTLASAIAASRLGADVGYITKVGNDYFKDYLISSWQNEGLDISQIKFSNEPNGLYIISRPKDSHKEIAYYRKKTAATKLSIDDISEEYIQNAKILYTSGIAQSISISAKEAVKKAYEIAKIKGLTTAYDPNFSDTLMTQEEAKENFAEVISNIDILFLSSKNDVQNLLELTSAEKVIKYFWDLGVKIVVVKASEDMGYYTGYNGDIVFTKFYTTEVVDTTCSGDAFNGGFLYAVSNGYTPFEATKLASVVAGLQSKGIGAIKSIPDKNIVLKSINEVENN